MHRRGIRTGVEVREGEGEEVGEREGCSGPIGGRGQSCEQRGRRGRRGSSRISRER